MNDILFMARGSRNYSILLGEIPGPALAAAYFFIVRASDERLLPAFLCWYLNQAPVERYLTRHSGRGVHMPVIRRSVLENLEIPLPDLETQKRIVELELLRKVEKDLSNRLAEKRKRLIEAACLYRMKRNRSTETRDE
jgi:restriction endonuclease S subunit